MGCKNYPLITKQMVLWLKLTHPQCLVCFACSIFQKFGTGENISYDILWGNVVYHWMSLARLPDSLNLPSSVSDLNVPDTVCENAAVLNRTENKTQLLNCFRKFNPVGIRSHFQTNTAYSVIPMIVDVAVVCNDRSVCGRTASNYRIYVILVHQDPYSDWNQWQR